MHVMWQITVTFTWSLFLWIHRRVQRKVLMINRI